MVAAIWHCGLRPLIKQMLCDCAEAFWAPVFSDDCHRDNGCLLTHASRLPAGKRSALIFRGWGRLAVLPFKALKGLPEQVHQLTSDFFGDDSGWYCLGGASLIQS
ncbi:hypothetical protein [Comamonas testosteroni]|jgi:hypothetical protein|uniref:hypothetical protein n=1 Tax=Comamonas testosteroni TaxID=285 RepID=UPI0026EE983C|nr:hypothetical protein [Comamonas testosteroni]WQD41281.1 hypothetical protein U0024_16025 [Comamonas testosteroni]